MKNNFDITLYPTDNGLTVALDTYGPESHTRRYNAVTIGDALEWIGARLREFAEAAVAPKVPG